MPTPTPTPDTLETQLAVGGGVKTLAREADRLRVGGYLVLFGSPATPDLSRAGDYFTKGTDFGLDVARRGIIRWQHCLDPQIGQRRLGIAEVKSEPDDVGLWAEGWMALRDEYDRKVAAWIDEHKVGWSSAALPHTIVRKAVGDGRKPIHEVTAWPLGGGDFSLTMIPADPRQAGSVVSLKSWLASDTDAASLSLLETLRRLASDAGAVWPLVERAHAARKAEGRTLSSDKLAVLQDLHQQLGRLLEISQRPTADQRRAALAELGEMLAKVRP